MFRRYWFVENMPDSHGFNISLQRRMERAGLVHRSAPGSVVEGAGDTGLGEREELWFADKTHAPKRTAHYIKRLNQLRDQLIHQESKNIERSLDRFRQQTFQREAVKQNVIRRTKRQGANEKLPAKPKKMVTERYVRYGRYSPPAIQGEKLIEGFEEAHTDRGNETIYEDPGADDDASMLISEQAARLNFKSLQHTLRPQQSIPNIHRKSHKLLAPLELSPEYNSYENDTPRSNTFVKQMALHQKDQRGLYRGRKRQELTHADGDELDLYPNSFRYDASHGGDSDSEDEELNGRKFYTGPRVSPVEWSDAPNKFKLSRHKDAGTGPSRPGGRAPKPSWTTPRMPAHNHSSITKQNIQEYHNHARNHGLLGEGTRSKTCLFCTHPNISQQLDYILFSRSGTTILDEEVYAPPPGRGPTPDQDVVTANSLRAEGGPGATPDRGLQPDGQPNTDRLKAKKHKKLVQVKMPDVILTQEDSSPGGEGKHYGGSLGRTTIQNELRQKEVKALAEDIKDLNEVEKSLKLQLEHRGK